MNKNYNIKISVIVPVYNAEKYLEQLVESLINQTFKEMEFIFVNDGSTDDSLNLLNELALKDERIVVIDKDNEGVSVARNTGLKKASGCYIGFVDADDFVAENMYEKLYTVAEKNNADVVSCGYNFYSESEIKPMLNDCELMMNQEQSISCLIDNKILGMSIWNKLYKSEILKDVWFNKEYRSNEDRLFSFMALRNAHVIAVIKDTLYFYRLNMNSFSHSSFKLAKMDGLYVSEEMDRIITKEFPQLSVRSYANIIRIVYSIIVMMYKDKAYHDFSTEYCLLTEMIKKADLSKVKKYCSVSIYVQLIGIKYCEPLIRFIKCFLLSHKIK